MFKAVTSLASRWIERRRARNIARVADRAETYRLEQEALEKQREAWREADRRRSEFLNCKRIGEMDEVFLAASDEQLAAMRAVRRVLVVVDMQPHYLNGYSDSEKKLLVDAVAEQICLARALGWPIVFLEFQPTKTYGQTLPELTALVDGYEPNYRVLGKYERSGAGEVLRACEHAGFDYTGFQVCGIYADQCVQDTVTNIALNRTECVVAVVPTACRSYYQVNGMENQYDWLTFPRCENIDLLPAPTAYKGHGFELTSAHPTAFVQPATANPEHLAPSAPQRQCP
jgi:hypothetical protein